ncbi:MAG: TolC family protein [Capsulimonas sp.]|uniref:TolC family protein n=1 Tax=Capsulimonas sp. TaxID=2494211 RepID=UPI003263F232
MIDTSHRYFGAALLAALFLGGSVAASAADPVIAAPALTLSLAQAVALANKNSPIALRQRADAAIAAAAARGAQAQQKPTLSATAYGALGDSSNILSSAPGVTPQNLFAVPPRGFADQNLTLMVPISTGGKIRGTIDFAQRQADAASLMTQATQLTIHQNVTEAYTTVLLSHELVSSAQARLDAEEEQVRITGERVTAGRSAPVDLLREQAEEADARQMLLSGQNDEQIAKVNLKAALAMSQDQQIELSDTLDALLAAPPDASLTQQEAIHKAEDQRPEIASALRQFEAAQAAVASAKGAYSPQVYAVAMGDAMAMQGGGRTGYTIGLSVSLPLMDGGQRRAEVDGAKARVDAAQADVLSIRQQVDKEAAFAWLALQTATARVAATATGVTAAQQGYELAAMRYNAGKSVAAERLDSLSALTRAKSTEAQAKAELIVARARLNTALGHLAP